MLQSLSACKGLGVTLRLALRLDHDGQAGTHRKRLDDGDRKYANAVAALNSLRAQVEPYQRIIRRRSSGPTA